MADVTITYKGNAIATMDATGSKTLETAGKYCEDDIGIAYVKPSGGGGTVVRTGTFTPTTKELTASFDVGTTDTIKNVLVVPTSENPIKSDGRILYAFIVNADLYAKSIIIPTNSGGSGLQTPNASTSSTRMTQSGSTITLTSTSSYGQFQLISYTWFAW